MRTRSPTLSFYDPKSLTVMVTYLHWLSLIDARKFGMKNDGICNVYIENFVTKLKQQNASVIVAEASPCPSF